MVCHQLVFGKKRGKQKLSVIVKRNVIFFLLIYSLCKKRPRQSAYLDSWLLTINHVNIKTETIHSIDLMISPLRPCPMATTTVNFNVNTDYWESKKNNQTFLRFSSWRVRMTSILEINQIFISVCISPKMPRWNVCWGEKRRFFFSQW